MLQASVADRREGHVDVTRCRTQRARSRDGIVHVPNGSGP
jgi:hypothetical protein